MAAKQTTTLPSRQDGTAPTTAADLLSRITGGGKRTSNEISPAGYDDCFDHVIGSAAEVERLWSIARYILTTTRSRMTPMMFEALLFLRANRELWDETTVQKAMNAVRREQKDERLQKKMDDAAVQEQEYGDSEEDDEDEDEAQEALN